MRLKLLAPLLALALLPSVSLADPQTGKSGQSSPAIAPLPVSQVVHLLTFREKAQIPSYETLAALGPGLYPTLWQIAQDKTQVMLLRVHAIEFLGVFHPEGYLDRLSQLALSTAPMVNKNDKYLRYAAASTLGGFGSKALPVITKTLQHSDPWMRHQGAKSLKRVGGPLALQVAQKMIVSESDKLVLSDLDHIINHPRMFKLMPLSAPAKQ